MANPMACTAPAATIAAVCAGRVDGEKILQATEAELSDLFFGTPLLQSIAASRIDGPARVSPDDFPRWVVGVPAFLRACEPAFAAMRVEAAAPV